MSLRFGMRNVGLCRTTTKKVGPGVLAGPGKSTLRSARGATKAGILAVNRTPCLRNRLLGLLFGGL